MGNHWFDDKWTVCVKDPKTGNVISEMSASELFSMDKVDVKETKVYRYGESEPTVLTTGLGEVTWGTGHIPPMTSTPLTGYMDGGSRYSVGGCLTYPADDEVTVWDGVNGVDVYVNISKGLAHDMAMAGKMRWNSDKQRWELSGASPIGKTFNWSTVDGKHMEWEQNDIETSEVERVERTNEYVEIIKSKKYRDKLSFTLKEDTVIETYDIVVGEKFDVMSKQVHAGAAFELERAYYDIRNKERVFTFKRDGKYADMSHEFASKVMHDFERLDVYVEESRADRRKKKLQAEKRKQRKAEEAEVNRIVLETHREEGGFGAWS